MISLNRNIKEDDWCCIFLITCWMFGLLISVPQLLIARRSISTHRIYIKRFRVRGNRPFPWRRPHVLRLQIASAIIYQRDLNLSPWSRAPLTRHTIRYQWKCNERAWRLACNAMHFHHSYYEWRPFTPLRVADVCLFSARLLVMYNVRYQELYM